MDLTESNDLPDQSSLTRGVSAGGGRVTPYRRIITYTARDKNRVERERAQLAAVAPPPVPLRRSMRLQPAVPFQPDPARGIFTIPQLRTDGNAIHPWINDKPRPLIDRNNVIMAVVAGAPKYNALWWDGIQREAFRFLVRVFKTANFSELDGEPRLRFGMTFGEDYAGVHQINNLVPNLSAIKQLENCEYLQAISGYQNHLYQHFAAYGHATVRSKVDELLRREIAFPGYQDSVFTTTDISISGPSSLSRKNVAAAFDTMEVITVLGSWNPRTGGGIVFWDDVCVLELIPGATVMFPAGSKRYSLVAVAPHETRFVFRQYALFTISGLVKLVALRSFLLLLDRSSLQLCALAELSLKFS
ncbi:hypothetical protein B0H14DRAFT_3427565 [Mycena olivaceomarginata]|nr:hypothetical protein B0H14DRAFT_3427565 [Mycena olivaceomarginata]